MASSGAGEEPAVHVMVAGLPRNGKSTSLNNIFDLEFPAKISAKPVTQSVVSETLTKYGISIRVTDTPGLKAADAHRNNIVMRDIKNEGIKSNFLLLLTLPVSESSSITQDYCNILKNLTTIFGVGIWNWSLVLLTFSDDIQTRFSGSNNENQDYLNHLKDHCSELEKVLKEIKVKKTVRPFFEYSSSDQFKAEKLDGIVAIPVGKVPDVSTEKLLPLQPWSHRCKWTELAFKEISKISQDIPKATLLQAALIQLRYGKYMYLVEETVDKILKAGLTGAVGGAAGGAAKGAKIGAKRGAHSGPLSAGAGMLAGGAAGALAGAIAGGVGGAAAAAIVYIDVLIELEESDKAKQQQESPATNNTAQVMSWCNLM